MVLILLALLLVETLTGLYVANDIADEGPMTEMAPAWARQRNHSLSRDRLGRSAGGHRLACSGDRRGLRAIKGQNLLRPMITGTKLLPAERGRAASQAARR